MSLRLTTRHLGKQFGEFHAVRDVSLAFEPGLIHAVLGENGAGKSTLMKLLFGLHKPTTGEIQVNGESVHWRSPLDAITTGFGMVQQHFTLVESSTAIDNIMLGAETTSGLGRLNRAEAIRKIEAQLPNRSLAVEWLKPVSEMSVGEKQRVEILKLLFRDAKLLFLDEPTAVLAPTEIDEFFDVLRALKAQGRTIVLITHKINEVLAVCDTYTVLRQGRMIGGGPVAGSTTDQIVEQMIGRKVPAFDPPRPSAKTSAALEARDLNGINLVVREGEIVGIAGIEGSGQNPFVEAVMGLRPFTGKLAIGGHEIEELECRKVRERGVGLVPEDRLQQGLWLDHSCRDNMIIGLEDSFVRGGVFHNERIKSSTDEWSQDYDVRAANLEVPVGRLSGGNQQKIIFAREVNGRKPRLLICQQPTRGVDLGAIDLIHRKLMDLRNEGLGLLVLSSELDELLKLCDRIVVFFDGTITASFERAQFDAMKIGAAMTGVHE